MNLKTVIVLFIAIFMVSCGAKKNAKTAEWNYMQNIEQIAKEAANKNIKNTIQPGDQLSIFVTAKDMDVVKPFNQNYSAYETTQSSVTGISSLSIPKNTGPTYLVNSQGIIDFPNVGQINTSLMTVEELKEKLENEISRYVKNPVVNIRLINFVVTVLGEVNRPGDYNIPNGQATIFNALGLAGDISMYGKKDQILIVRTENGEMTNTQINLKDANFINSPFFNLKQGDVIYVPSTEIKEQIAKQNPQTGIYLTIAGLAISSIAIILSVLK